ncbi:ABC transporter permease [Limibacter armeniacum]|uniref:ABC transporter permease n=1 Tax=Limibacter armeniacum TaxID=466084 RepID=UPI002FE6C03D
MLKYIAKRLVNGFFVLQGVILITFFLFHTLPGDPVELMAGQNADIQTREMIRQDLGLDKPLHVQYAYYLNDLSPISVYNNTPANQAKYDYHILIGLGDKVLTAKMPYLRRSFQSNRRVDEILIDSLPGTLWLALASMLFATVVGIILGLIAALKYNTFWDNFFVTTSVFGISTPSFVSAILISITFGYYLSDFTHLSMTGSLWENHPIYGRELHLENIILPAFTLGIRPLAIIMQLTRSSMLDVLSQDYILTAKAKGLAPIAVILKHALKNALNPVITTVSGWLASLTTGAFFVEYIFKWKGIGLKTIQAIEFLDLPIIIGSTLMIASIFILINIIVDILYAVIDPRVRLY